MDPPKYGGLCGHDAPKCSRHVYCYVQVGASTSWQDTQDHGQEGQIPGYGQIDVDESKEPDEVDPAVTNQSSQAVDNADWAAHVAYFDIGLWAYQRCQCLLHCSKHG